jgi:PH (Pleckstrin Homology) domain-containing protein
VGIAIEEITMNPGDAQLRAQSELQSGESLFWTGTADPARAALSALPAMIFGIPFAGFALFWINGAYQATSHISKSADAFSKGFAVFPIFGLPFLAIGLGIVSSPLWAYLKGRSTVYAVTNQRVMVITGSGTRSVKSFTPADIVFVEHRERPDGSGDVLIRTTGTTRTNNSMSQITISLLGVSNVKEVAQQVMNLHSQRPAA